MSVSLYNFYFYDMEKTTAWEWLSSKRIADRNCTHFIPLLIETSSLSIYVSLCCIFIIINYPKLHIHTNRYYKVMNSLTLVQSCYLLIPNKRNCGIFVLKSGNYGIGKYFTQSFSQDSFTLPGRSGPEYYLIICSNHRRVPAWSCNLYRITFKVCCRFMIKDIEHFVYIMLKKPTKKIQNTIDM